MEEVPFSMEEFDSKRRAAMGKVVGTFLVLAISLLAISLATDTIESKKSQKMLVREADWKRPEVKPLVPKKAGGIKALDKFATKIMNFGVVNTTKPVAPKTTKPTSPKTHVKGPSVTKNKTSPGQAKEQAKSHISKLPPTRSRTGT